MALAPRSRLVASGALLPVALPPRRRLPQGVVDGLLEAALPLRHPQRQGLRHLHRVGRPVAGGAALVVQSVQLQALRMSLAGRLPVPVPVPVAGEVWVGR